MRRKINQSELTKMLGLAGQNIKSYFKKTVIITEFHMSKKLRHRKYKPQMNFYR